MKLEKAKRVVLARSKCAPAKVEKAAMPLSTETKSLLIHHHPSMEQPLLSQETGRSDFLDNSRSSSLTALPIPTSQCVRGFLILRLGRAISCISLFS